MERKVSTRWSFTFPATMNAPISSCSWRPSLVKPIFGHPALRLGIAQLPRDLDDLEHFKLIANLDVVESFKADTALVARGDLLGIVLEAFEGGNLSGMDHDAFPDDVDAGAALDCTREDVAAGDGADLRNLEGFSISTVPMVSSFVSA
jgi:hypothetical protein